ncbi:MAG TPA: hypothetical protein VEB64_07385 [Azospirillaceae bacterium]|nr:hypothetical protein [Azospirillaceae bacterium]
MMRWTNPIRLKDFEKTPKENGIFQVGLMRVQMFDPKYVGRALGEERTIRVLLQTIHEGRKLAKVDATNRDNLFCRWYVTDDLEGTAPDLLKRFGIGILQQFIWNNAKNGID